MAEVRAGVEQPTCAPGQPGLATVWVRSETEKDALTQAQTIMNSRRYQSIGDVTAYLEHEHGSTTTGAGHEDPLALGYSSVQEKALASGDGLFEIWFPPK
jgi:hypothetical protein